MVWRTAGANLLEDKNGAPNETSQNEWKRSSIDVMNVIIILPLSICPRRERPYEVSLHNKKFIEKKLKLCCLATIRCNRWDGSPSIAFVPKLADDANLLLWILEFGRHCTGLHFLKTRMLAPIQTSNSWTNPFTMNLWNAIGWDGTLVGTSSLLIESTFHRIRWRIF